MKEFLDFLKPSKKYVYGVLIIAFLIFIFEYKKFNDDHNSGKHVKFFWSEVNMERIHDTVIKYRDTCGNKLSVKPLKEAKELYKSNTITQSGNGNVMMNESSNSSNKINHK